MKISHKLCASITVIILLCIIMLSVVIIHNFHHIEERLMISEQERSCLNASKHLVDSTLLQLQKALLCWSTDPRLVNYALSTSDIKPNNNPLVNEWHNYILVNQYVKKISYLPFRNFQTNALTPEGLIHFGEQPGEQASDQRAVAVPNQIVFSSPYLNEENQIEWLISLSKAVIKDKRVLGVVRIEVKAQSLIQQLQQISSHQQNTFIIIDTKDRIIVHPNTRLISKKTEADPVLNVVLEKSNASGLMEWDEQKIVYATKEIADGHWKVVSFQALQIPSSMNSFAITALTCVFAASVLLIVGTIISTHWIVKPLVNLTQTVENVSSGQSINPLKLKTKDEISVIDRAFTGMLDSLKQSDRDLDSALNQMHQDYIATVRVLANAIEAKDQYTRGHCDRVSTYALALAKGLNYDDEALQVLEFASILHDIGKVGIPDGIIGKTSPLTNEEFELIRAHPRIGAEILADVHFLKESANILHQHHEREDGLGYPLGLRAHQIHKSAKILAIADAYDAMTSNRPYRKAPFSKRDALLELERNCGKQFDKELVHYFIMLMTTQKIQLREERNLKCIN